jgi:DNA adenine methylase
VITKPALRYHGGKFRLAPWIMSFFPEHTCYVEPFGGAAGVLLQKHRAYAEVYNDLDSAVANFFQVLRDPAARRQLVEAVTLTPYARTEYDLAWTETEDPIEAARRLCIRAQMGFGSAGATKGTTGFRVDTKREYGTAQQLWAEYPAALAAVGERLTGVLVENRPAIEVMRQHDGPDTLHFVDPPYVMSTRTRSTGNGRAYRHEMTDDDHAELLEVLRNLRGMVVVSGYWSELYDSRLGDWTSRTTTSRIAAGRGCGIRDELVWINPACTAALEREEAQARLFA